MDREIDQWLWAKSSPYKMLSRHMLDAGACAYAYLSQAGMSGVVKKLADLFGCQVSDAIRFIAYLVALHDIGKASSFFQRSAEELYQTLPPEMRARFARYGGSVFRHERESARAMLRIWKAQGYFDRKSLRTLSAVLALHHQGKRGEMGVTPDVEWWRGAQARLEERIRAAFCPKIPQVYIRHHDALGAYLTGLVVLCDWVASSEAFDYLEAEGDEAYRDRAMRRAEEVLSQYGLRSSTRPVRVGDFSSLFHEITLENMRPVQRACADVACHKAPLTIIEAPMGEGKTEAALYLASIQRDLFDLQGIYMALPTAATSNQMYHRFCNMQDAQGGLHNVRLLHSLAWLLDDMSPEAHAFRLDAERESDAQYATDWLAPSRRGLLTENAVGTVDQAMAAVIYRKYGLLRLVGLASKVLVIDEIHAYDVYMSEIISRLLKWCRALSIPVVLLSATMQKAQKRYYLACYGIGNEASLSDAYPLVTQVDIERNLRETAVDGVFMKSRIRLQTSAFMDEPEKIAQRAVEKVKNGGCLCVMMNTVKKAQAVYTVIKKLAPEDAMLFHARFLNKRRAEIENNCIALFGKDAGEKRPHKAILVCTQVVEQSLDVDFDGMMTELAPIDLILQRSGRVHRHRGRERLAGFEHPEIEILTPEKSAPSATRYGATGAVYDPYILGKTEALLAHIEEVAVPDDIRDVIERVYESLPEEQIEAYIKSSIQKEMQKISAEAIIFPEPCADEFFGIDPGLTGKFERPDEDSGFRIAKGASTRYDANSARVAFLDEELFRIANQNLISKRDAIRILENSVSMDLSILPGFDTITRNQSETHLITSGHLNGCLAIRTVHGIARIGDRVIHVDDELGVWIKE